MFIKRLAFLVGIILFLGGIQPSFARPINPSLRPTSPETDLDRYFRIAFSSALAEDFDTAIINYHRAVDAASNECDRQHAEAGIQAATEVKNLIGAGANSLLTQEFWSRLRHLALPLPCTTER